jgi:hypothetical protein
MKTVEIEVLKKVKTTFLCLHGHPIMGDAEAIAQICNVKQILHCNWDRQVEKVLPITNLEKLDIEYFTPTDKGGCPVFGVDKNGDIIFGITFFTGVNNPLEDGGQYNGPHFYCCKASSTISY